MFSRTALKQNWREVRPYFWIAIILFAAGLVAGASTHLQIGWLDRQIEGLKQISDEASNSDHPQRMFFVIIFLNNIVKSLFGLYLGLVACIFPVFMLVVNGLVMGYMFGGLAEQGADIGMIIVKGILPHGIFELPAVFLACAMGIRLGVELLKSLANTVRGKATAWEGFMRAIKGSVPIVILVTIMLFIAAGIESTITLWLVK